MTSERSTWTRPNIVADVSIAEPATTWRMVFTITMDTPRTDRGSERYSDEIADRMAAVFRRVSGLRIRWAGGNSQGEDAHRARVRITLLIRFIAEPTSRSFRSIACMRERT